MMLSNKLLHVEGLRAVAVMSDTAFWIVSGGMKSIFEKDYVFTLY